PWPDAGRSRPARGRRPARLSSQRSGRWPLVSLQPYEPDDRSSVAGRSHLHALTISPASHSERRRSGHHPRLLPLLQQSVSPYDRLLVPPPTRVSDVGRYLSPVLALIRLAAYS